MTMKRALLSAALAGLLLTAAHAGPDTSTPAVNAGPAPVYCGSFTPFHFRVNAAGKTAEARALAAMDVINKFLGGKVGKVTTKPDPKDAKSIRLLLNNEVVALITPQDAAAEKMKTPALLAAKWTKLLSTAFDASKAQPG
jgi:hypothetical protein